MIGEILRKRREELGLDLKEAAHTLRIQYEYLKALESDNIGKLPPAVYTRGYIREYARFIGLDPEPLVDDYAGHAGPVADTQPEPAPQEKKPALSGKLLVAPLLLVLVAVVIILFPKGKTPSKTLSQEHVSSSPASVSSLPSPSIDHRKLSSPPVNVSSRPSSSKDRTKLSLLPPPVTSGAGYVLNVIAAESTWLHIETGDGRSEEMLMKAGESKNWTSQKGFDLKLGNAGGVRLVINGKDLGVPGEKGRVLRLKFPREDGRLQSPG